MMAEEARPRSGSILFQSVAMLRQAAAKYEDMIVRDPNFTSNLESALKVASYIIPGRFGGSWEMSELAYCITNLYSLGNDFIIARRCPASCKISKRAPREQSLLWVLSVLDCIEVCLEMMTQHFAGEPSKWGIVILMQTVRAVLRSLLVFKHGHGLVCTPSVPPPDRNAAQALHGKVVDSEGEPLAWKAPRTGKVVRSIHADESVPYSQLHHYVAPPSPPSGQSSVAMTEVRRRLRGKQLLAEALYIARPLVHVFSMILFSQKSWKPWLLSLSVDVLSLQLLGAPTSYKNALERSEVMRRRAVLLLYLLRSPFYDKYIKFLLILILNGLSRKLPLARFVIGPILEYLPIWQQVYSYNWAT